MGNTAATGVIYFIIHNWDPVIFQSIFHCVVSSYGIRWTQLCVPSLVLWILICTVYLRCSQVVQQSLGVMQKCSRLRLIIQHYTFQLKTCFVTKRGSREIKVSVAFIFTIMLRMYPFVNVNASLLGILTVSRCGQRQMRAATIPEGQIWPRVKQINKNRIWKISLPVYPHRPTFEKHVG